MYFLIFIPYILMCTGLPFVSDRIRCFQQGAVLPNAWNPQRRFWASFEIMWQIYWHPAPRCRISRSEKHIKHIRDLCFLYVHLRVPFQSYWIQNVSVRGTETTTRLSKHLLLLTCDALAALNQKMKNKFVQNSFAWMGQILELSVIS